jgi:polyhydroxyalkanoate synthesis repressor PhaR
MDEQLIIKKYSNRRLYDTEKSIYVSLNHVADMIREGRKVKVVDAKTNEDVTAFILTQVILEQAKKNNILLPVPLLHLIIQYGEDILAEFFEKYLHQTISNYLAYKSAFDEQFKSWLEMGMDLSAMADQAMAEMTPFQNFFNLSSNPADARDKEDSGE